MQCKAQPCSACQVLDVAGSLIVSAAQLSVLTGFDSLDELLLVDDDGTLDPKLDRRAQSCLAATGTTRLLWMTTDWTGV